MRLIDADALGEPYKIVINNRSVVDQSVYLAKDIENAPTVDAVPVVHGKWIRPEDIYTPQCSYRWKCTACGGISHYVGGNAKKIKGQQKCGYAFCPRCGAKMMDEAE